MKSAKEWRESAENFKGDDGVESFENFIRAVQQDAQPKWISVKERLPERCKEDEFLAVLAIMRRENGTKSVLRCEYLHEKQRELSSSYEGDDVLYDEVADQYYYPAGWWELVDNWDEYAFVKVVEGEITHWMPLPELPHDPA